jgi:hypothetical protein
MSLQCAPSPLMKSSPAVSAKPDSSSASEAPQNELNATFRLIPNTLLANRQIRGLLFAALTSLWVSAQTPLPGLKEFGNRFEGSLIEPHAAEDFRIIGLHRLLAKFDRNADLRVRFFLPPGAAPETLSITAMEREDFEHYLMQSKSKSNWIANDWNEFGPWNTKDVIDSLDVRYGNLAVMATVGTSLLDYLPVDVMTLQMRDHVNRYTVYFVASRDLRSLSVTVTDFGGHPTTVSFASSCKFPDCTQFPAGSTQAITLDFSSLHDGRYHVTFSGRVPLSTDIIAKTISIYHKHQ